MAGSIASEHERDNVVTCDMVLAMSGDRTKILVVGVGGQGVLTVARMLGDAALAAGLDVRVGQLHGMAQRGGSVEALVLLGPGKSTFIGDGEADVVLGLEPLETLRALPRMSPRTCVVLNSGRVVPFTMVRDGTQYPPLEKILDRIRAVAPQPHVVDGPALLEQAGAPRSLNICLLGALAGQGILPLEEQHLWQAVANRIPAKHLEANRRAYELGRDAVQHQRPSAQ